MYRDDPDYDCCDREWHLNRNVMKWTRISNMMKMNAMNSFVTHLQHEWCDPDVNCQLELWTLLIDEILVNLCCNHYLLTYWKNRGATIILIMLAVALAKELEEWEWGQCSVTGAWAGTWEGTWRGRCLWTGDVRLAAPPAGKSLTWKEWEDSESPKSLRLGDGNEG